jgi:DNA-binding transcriptional LysR family regulator
MVYGSRNPKYDFRWVPLAEDRFYAILPKDFPLAGNEFHLSGFNGTKFLMPGLGFDDDISAVFSENSVKPFVTQTYVDDPAIISMVEHRLGISMLSELILTARKDAVRFVPIVPEVSRKLAIAMRGDGVQTPAMKRLVHLTKEYVKRYKNPVFGDIE